ncbi:MAG: transcriptional regulator [Acidobacteriales bacterium]|nr:transcriptional regulator [Terriglobales bacterium]
MKRGVIRKSLLVLAFGLVSTALLASGSWQVLGPDGGDARSLAYDSHNPDHMLLGTSTGQLFVSNDAGHSWSRFARLGGDDYVLDHIAIDPQDSKRVYVSAWSLSSQQIGDIYRTRDGGKNWETLPAMHGKSIRAMAVFHANSKVLVAGALEGVFRSKDGGDSWERMSPANHSDIKNIESIAVDPKDSNIVYAGTWHLAWKTADGGASWQQIKKGMIDDSDVFSVIVDHANPAVVFASACSGIYKSESAGNQFSKIQGIPFSARRTRVLKQDPTNENIVYAGTTEGLWKTMDLGKTWKRVSNPEIVVNDVLVDPRDSNHVLLATDRSGVMASNDGTQSWSTSNRGYAHRYVSALLADVKEADTFYVGLVNDREYGGVFYTRDAGRSWLQRSAGLGGRDIFSLKQAAGGTLVAGTNRGMFSLERNASEWRPMNAVVTEQIVKTTKKGSKKAATTTIVKKSELDARVNDLELGSQRWLAATTQGIFSSTDQGKTWKGGPVLGQKDFVSVRAQGSFMVATTRSSALVSNDSGATWKQAGLPSYLVGIRGSAIAHDGGIVIAAREGVFRSGDNGTSWEHVVNGLPGKDITSVSFDAANKRLLATSDSTGVIFVSSDSGRSWQRGPDSGFPLRRVSVVGGRFVAATPFDGVVVQPEDGNISAAAGTGSTN